MCVSMRDDDMNSIKRRLLTENRYADYLNMESDGTNVLYKFTNCFASEFTISRRHPSAIDSFTEASLTI